MNGTNIITMNLYLNMFLFLRVSHVQFFSYSLTQPYSCLAANLNSTREQLICRSKLCIILQSNVMVLLLLVPELANGGDQLLVLLAVQGCKLPDLVVVVLSDRCLHRHRACHGPLLSKEGGASSKGKPCHIPEGQEGSWASSFLRKKFVKCCQVVLFLVPHMLYHWTNLCVAQDGHLTSINSVSSKFASMIYPQHAIKHCPCVGLLLCC